MGSLFNVRHDIASRTAYKYNTSSMSSSYLSMTWLVLEAPTQCWALKAGTSVKRVSALGSLYLGALW